MSLNYKELREFIRYFSRFNDEFARFYVNMAFEGHTPIPGLSNMYLLEIKANEVFRYTYPISKELVLTDYISYEVSQALASLDIVDAGEIAYSRLNKIYFYGTEDVNVDFEKITNSIMKKYEQFQFNLSKVNDPSWDFYTEYLLPNEYEIQSYYSETIIDILKESGDNFEAKRIIDFHLVFENNNDMNNAVEKIKSLGFGIESKEEDGKFRIIATRISPALEIGHITPMVNSLIDVATECNGYFKGWDCPKIVRKEF